jgi:membrane protein YqaA with SNARE-associated domain
MHFSATAAVKSTFWSILLKLGGPGLILIGLVDNSVIPLPGGMDIVTIILAASRRELWWYYALFATVGSLIGGYLTYRLGVKGGKEVLEKKVSKKRAEKVYRIFERYGFWSVVVGAMSPPPIPIAPFLIAAGAMKYRKRKFFAALTLGRGIRYTIVAYLASLYGRHVFSWLGRYYRPVLYTVIGLGVVGGLIAWYYWRRYKRESDDASDARPERPAPKVA